MDPLNTMGVGGGIWILTEMVGRAFAGVRFVTKDRLALVFGLGAGIGLAATGSAPSYFDGILSGLIGTATAAYGNDFVAKPVAAKVKPGGAK